MSRRDYLFCLGLTCAREERIVPHHSFGFVGVALFVFVCSPCQFAAYDEIVDKAKPEDEEAIEQHLRNLSGGRLGALFDKLQLVFFCFFVF